MAGLLIMFLGIVVLAPIASRAHSAVLWAIGGAVMIAAMVV
jgi:hypothetical protein